MAFFFINFAVMLAAIIIIYFGMWAQVFFSQLTVVENVLSLLWTLSDNGIVGIFVILDIFINYYLYIYLRGVYRNIKT
jgi:hypothetical protein|tara:strand:+ start:588 stop:821 length:234 start_codon:yes stop_codon:yes gene_type:complete